MRAGSCPIQSMLSLPSLLLTASALWIIAVQSHSSSSVISFCIIISVHRCVQKSAVDAELYETTPFPTVIAYEILYGLAHKRMVNDNGLEEDTMGDW